MSAVWRFNLIPSREDLEAVEDIAKRLRDEDDVITLINVVEWLERNISYWHEKAYSEVMIAYIILPAVSLMLISFLYSAFTLNPVLINVLNNPLMFIAIFGVLFVSIYTLVAFIYCLLGVKMVMFVLIVYPILLLFNRQATQGSGRAVTLAPLGLYVALIVALSFLFLFLFTAYSIPYYYAKRFNEFLKVVLDLIKLTFKVKPTVRELLAVRRGVCRDYVLLASSLLIKLFPNNRLYIFITRIHVAVGLEYRDEIYVIDQRLPVLPFNTWINAVCRGDLLETLIIYRKDGGIVVEKTGKPMVKHVELNYDLEGELRELVEETSGAIEEKRFSIQHVLIDYAKLLDINDEVIRRSLVRKTQLVLEKELISKFVENIELHRRGDDIVIEVKLRKWGCLSSETPHGSREMHINESPVTIGNGETRIPHQTGSEVLSVNT